MINYLHNKCIFVPQSPKYLFSVQIHWSYGSVLKRSAAKKTRKVDIFQCPDTLQLYIYIERVKNRKVIHLAIRYFVCGALRINKFYKFCKLLVFQESQFLHDYLHIALTRKFSLTNTWQDLLLWLARRLHQILELPPSTYSFKKMSN